MTGLPVAPDVLESAVQLAETPLELMRVRDMAGALAEYGRRVRKSKVADGLREEAAEAYRIEIAAVFAQLQVVVKAAEILPDRGRPDEKFATGMRISADDFGVSHTTAARWKWLGSSAAPIDMDAERDQWQVIADDDPSAWDDPSMTAIIRKALAGKRPAAESTPALPDDKYRCIVIDPPWPMDRMFRGKFPGTGQHVDYSTMTIEQLEELDVGSLAADGCHVYLWVTHRFLPAGLDLFEQWGVAYQCVMTWRKNEGMTPFSWQYDTEHVLFGRIGALKLQRLGLRLSFDAAKTAHSVKPDVFYERVLQASPAPRLEMFARTARDGFDAWGAEAPDAD